MNWDWIEMGIQ